MHVSVVAFEFQFQLSLEFIKNPLVKNITPRLALFMGKQRF